MESFKKRVKIVRHPERERRISEILRRFAPQNDKERVTFFLLVFILLLGAFLRLYRIDGYMTFLGDEGRDALVWLRMVRNGKFTLIGPQTSIGNMYLGPLYYYLMLPFYVLFGLSPVGPSVGVAFFGVATIFLIWWIGREWFGEIAGLTAAFLYALSPVVITYSRSSWNPNIMPFFALSTIWGIWQFWKKEKFIWLPIIGVNLSFCLQSHYLGLLLIPVIGIFWGFRAIGVIRGKDKGKDKGDRGFWCYSLVCLLLFFLLTLVPLVWFDLRHNFINAKAFYQFFAVRQTTVNFKAYKALPNLWPLWQMMITRLLAAREVVWGRWLAVFLLLGLLLQGQSWSKKPAFWLISAWIFVGLAGMGLYKQHIYDHYFGFLFPAPFLLIGFLLQRLWDIKETCLPAGRLGKLGKLAVFGFLVVATYFNVMDSPLKWSPNYQMVKVQQVDRKIIQESGGQPFNFGLIAKQNYEAGYEYFLEYWRAPLVRIDPQKASQTIADQLFVVCEDEECKPIGHPKAEIANFGWVKIENQWEFDWGVKLFKLVHNTSS